MNYKKIGVENFRVFKDYTEFEIRPITLLTGPNNSGKSSLTKLILLLQNNLEQLNFEDGKHNLENFESILSWDSTAEHLVLRFENNISFLPSNFYTEFKYEKGELASVKIASPSSLLLEIEFSTDTSLVDYGSVGFIQTINFKISVLIDLLVTQSAIVKTIVEEVTGINKSKSKEIYLPLQEVVSLTESTDIVPSLINSHLEEIPFYAEQKGYALRNSAIKNFINKLPENPSIFKILINGKEPDEENKEIIKKFEEQAFSKIHFSNNMGMSFKLKNFKINFDYLIDFIPNQAEKNLQKMLDSQYGNNNTEIKYSSLYHLLFKDKIFFDSFEKFSKNPFEEDFERKLQFHQTWLEQFKNVPFDLLNLIGSFDFISPNRGSQQRVLMNKSNNQIDEIVLEFSKLPVYSQKLAFLQQAIEILEINGKLHVERHENYISVVSIIKNDKKTTLADLGFGYSQVIPILLKIILTASQSFQEKTLFIEEPEANLHPNLQSKLADVLALSLREFPNLNFIVETHSEYLIRKLQYLTAEKELSPDQSIIYYFNADKYVSKEEPKVKKIEITPTGNLTDTFGPGFYDEATKLKFDLMKLNREQNN